VGLKRTTCNTELTHAITLTKLSSGGVRQRTPSKPNEKSSGLEGNRYEDKHTYFTTATCYIPVSMCPDTRYADTQSEEHAYALRCILEHRCADTRGSC
jgi:hypothetical protein